MKALSIQQPWAWLIVNGYKDVENRDWPTKVRGWVAVHAGKKYDAAGAAWVRRTFPGIQLPREFASGAVVGIVRITDCVTAYASPWFQGHYGFVLYDAAPCDPVPARGQLGFFDVPLPAPLGASVEPTE